MAYLETDTPSGVMGFDISDDHASVSGIRGRDVELSIPDTVSYKGTDYPVTSIERKAFLSDRYLYKLNVPASVNMIDDWAFAGCVNLRDLCIGRKVTLGNGVFKDCRSLSRVRVHSAGDTTDADKDLPYLLAAVIRLMEDRFLFDPENAGSEQWYASWDMRMIRILDEPDEEGFSALLACGEEDYEGRDNTIEAFYTRKKEKKASVCMLRLLHDNMLSDENRKRISDYLYEHRAGTAYPAFWNVILKEHGDDEEYYSLMCRLGCVGTDNIDVILNDLGSSHPGMKSYIIRSVPGTGGGDFLDDLAF